MKNEFSSFHPLVCLAFIAAAATFSLRFSDPALAAVSLVGAAVSGILLGGRRAAKFELIFALPLFVLIAALNPLLSHEGFTMLFYLDDNPVTLEAAAYGVVLAAKTTALIIWLSCCVWIFTSDKVVWLFGSVFPPLGLFMSMTFRFVPIMCRRAGETARAQRGVGMGPRDGNTFERAKNRLRIFSMTLTWLIEQPLGTADAMKARGFGTGRRTAFSRFRFTERDALALAFIGASAAVCAAVDFTGTAACQYYPYFKWTRITAAYFPALAAYLALSFFPAVFEIKEARRWRLLRSET